MRAAAMGLVAFAAVLSASPDKIWAIEGGTPVPAGLSSGTGAVWTGNCSGMLVTPWWVLTAAHCPVAPSVTLAPGTTRGRTARVDRWIANPAYDAGASGVEPRARFDVALVRLATPLFPEFEDGMVWETYRRPIYRGSVGDLADQLIDIYGFGDVRDQNDGRPPMSGILRYGRMLVESADRIVNADGRSGEQTWQGDSGAAFLLPGHDTIAARDNYVIIGVNTHYRDTFSFDTENYGPVTTEFADWFDATLGIERDSFDAPSQIMAVLPSP